MESREDKAARMFFIWHLELILHDHLLSSCYHQQYIHMVVHKDIHEVRHMNKFISDLIEALLLILYFQFASLYLQWMK